MKIKVFVKPNSKHPRVERISTSEYRVYVHAPPTEGKANEAVILLLSEFFSVPKSFVSIRSGAHSKIKIIEIRS
ncbi:MAG: DUF167 domain-containing protein [Deltaproteobacteria bacterium]|nr:DUF167 domain-containing protein [Deltaproteobacteria bacterium]